MRSITVFHKNGYSGRLYGKSSLSIYNREGKEVFHTGFRNINTRDELYRVVDEYPMFIGTVGKLIEDTDDTLEEAEE